MLLEHCPSMLLKKDQWGRGPLDVAHENGENPLVDVITSFLKEKGDTDLLDSVNKLSAEFQKTKARPAISEDNKKAHKNIFGQLGGLAGGFKLKKVSVTEKQMFAKTQGAVTTGGANKDAKSCGKILSKLVDFPGDVDEIKGFLADPTKVDPGGADGT